jgi:hypothetical protein
MKMLEIVLIAYAKPPIISIIRGSIGNGCWGIFSIVQVLLQTFEIEPPLKWSAIIHEVKIRLCEIYNLFSFGVLDPRITNLPFLWNNPVINRRP